MKLNLLTVGLISGILIGCSVTNQDTPVEAIRTPEQKTSEPTSTAPKTEVSSFNNVSSPQESCNDSLPDDSLVYPITVYPVFIDYSELNFWSITTHLCQNAEKIFRNKTGKYAVQIAYFLTFERANQFKEWMLNKQVANIEVGEPTIMKIKTAPEPPNTPRKPQVPASKAAQLTSAQVKQLESLEKSNIVKSGELQVEAGKIKAIVPTYIPPGFQVDSFETKLNAAVGSEYSLVYRNSSNSCFRIFAFQGQGGDAPTLYETVKVSSPALGKVILTYTDSDEFHNGFSVKFPLPIYKNDVAYLFDSPAFGKNCNSVSLQEAVKIVESLQYLNP